jgi:hypothetical protein
VNCPWSIFLKWKWLHDHEVTWFWLLDVNQLVDLLVYLEQIRVGMFADFTLKCLPVHWCQVIGLPLLQLGWQPVLQALVVNESNTAWALTWHHDGIHIWGVISPAEPALQTLLVVTLIQSSHRNCFF